MTANLSPLTDKESKALEEMLGEYPYPDDGKNCPECAIPLTVDKKLDEAYCEMCYFTIYDYSEDLP